MPSKAKILVFGEILPSCDNGVNLLVRKVSTLNKSKAGPFDAAFVAGSCNSKHLSVLKTSDLPIPVYLHHIIIDDGDSDDSLTISSKDREIRTEIQTSSAPKQLASSLYGLVCNDRAGIWSIRINQLNLVVAACPRHVRFDRAATIESLMRSVQHESYRGCDILLTCEPPQGAETLFSTHAASDSVSVDVAEVALRARARYHFVSASMYQQSPAFSHRASATTSTDTTLHTGRLIEIAPLSDSKDKELKCVHALGIVPLLSMSTAELEQQLSNGPMLPCPFSDANYKIDNDKYAERQASGTTSNSSFSVVRNAGLSEATARRILAEEQHKRSDLLSSRWAAGSSRNKRNCPKEPIDSCNRTLFVHGLHKDVSGRLQSPEGSIALLQAFAPWKAARVRRPTSGSATSSFVFIEFESHAAALQCLQQTCGEVVVTGVHLTVKWASYGSANTCDTLSSNKKTRSDDIATHRLTEAEAKESSILYFKIVQADFTEASCEVTRCWAESVLEAALNENVEVNADRITAAEEPALQVQVRCLEKYGFLDFASHAAASMVIASLTGSVDGGLVAQNATGRPESFNGSTMYMHWAHPKSNSQPGQSQTNLIEDASGFTFKRKHFPKDSRQDCWFCLASESCEKHLITGVYDKCYSTLPKGPVHPGHVLIVPVEHLSNGVLKNATIIDEVENIKKKLREHARAAYNCDLFIFERAIETKGGYHSHVQCIPIRKGLGQRMITTMMAQATKTQMNLREIKSDLSTASLLSNENNCVPYNGYFSAEIPTASSGYQRFLHRQAPSSGSGSLNRVKTVPIQFGREVLAAVLGKPDLAHWMSCVLDKDEEIKLATEFRESFAQITDQKRM